MKAQRKIVVSNEQGLHARPADMIVKCVSRFKSRVMLVKGHERVDSKCILAILTLAAAAGTPLTIEADGDDAEDAVNALAELFENHFPEELRPA